MTVQENHFRTAPITQEINHHITQIIEEDHQKKKYTKFSTK